MANESMQLFMYLLYDDGKEAMLKKCPVPCEQTTYVTKTKRLHKNTFVYPTNSSSAGNNSSFVFMSIGYETLNTELHFETLIYDTGNFLTQIGGNLGLFLGVSCLSVMTDLIEFLHGGFVRYLFK